jgi:hypothetical protein
MDKSGALGGGDAVRALALARRHPSSGVLGSSPTGRRPFPSYLWEAAASPDRAIHGAPSSGRTLRPSCSRTVRTTKEASCCFC